MPDVVEGTREGPLCVLAGRVLGSSCGMCLAVLKEGGRVDIYVPCPPPDDPLVIAVQIEVNVPDALWLVSIPADRELEADWLLCIGRSGDFELISVIPPQDADDSASNDQNGQDPTIDVLAKGNLSEAARGVGHLCGESGTPQISLEPSNHLPPVVVTHREGTCAYSRRGGQGRVARRRIVAIPLLPASFLTLSFHRVKGRRDELSESPLSCRMQLWPVAARDHVGAPQPALQDMRPLALLPAADILTAQAVFDESSVRLLSVSASAVKDGESLFTLSALIEEKLVPLDPFPVQHALLLGFRERNHTAEQCQWRVRNATPASIITGLTVGKMDGVVITGAGKVSLYSNRGCECVFDAQTLPGVRSLEELGAPVAVDVSFPLAADESRAAAVVCVLTDTDALLTLQVAELWTADKKPRRYIAMDPLHLQRNAFDPQFADDPEGDSGYRRSKLKPSAWGTSAGLATMQTHGGTGEYTCVVWDTWKGAIARCGDAETFPLPGKTHQVAHGTLGTVQACAFTPRPGAASGALAATAAGRLARLVVAHALLPGIGAPAPLPSLPALFHANGRVFLAYDTGTSVLSLADLTFTSTADLEASRLLACCESGPYTLLALSSKVTVLAGDLAEVSSVPHETGLAVGFAHAGGPAYVAAARGDELSFFALDPADGRVRACGAAVRLPGHPSVLEPAAGGGGLQGGLQGELQPAVYAGFWDRNDVHVVRGGQSRAAARLGGSVRSICCFGASVCVLALDGFVSLLRADAEGGDTAHVLCRVRVADPHCIMRRLGAAEAWCGEDIIRVTGTRVTCTAVSSRARSFCPVGDFDAARQAVWAVEHNGGHALWIGSLSEARWAAHDVTADLQAAVVAVASTDRFVAVVTKTNDGAQLLLRTSNNLKKPLSRVGIPEFRDADVLTFAAAPAGAGAPETDSFLVTLTVSRPSGAVLVQWRVTAQLFGLDDAPAVKIAPVAVQPLGNGGGGAVGVWKGATYAAVANEAERRSFGVLHLDTKLTSETSGPVVCIQFAEPDVMLACIAFARTDVMRYDAATGLYVRLSHCGPGPLTRAVPCGGGGVLVASLLSKKSGALLHRVAVRGGPPPESDAGCPSPFAGPPPVPLPASAALHAVSVRAEALPGLPSSILPLSDSRVLALGSFGAVVVCFGMEPEA
ncbi:hypothetical protein DIPPA_16029 [Diplonema papillatum]|nr:hypothetical protein DIPPA_16029 [Diplonema papillatum]